MWKNTAIIDPVLFVWYLFTSFMPNRNIASPQQTGKTYTIKGVVLDFNNEPIIGASVFIPGTSIGVATDLDGNYVLKVTGKHEKL